MFPKFYGKIEHGRLFLDDDDLYNDYLNSLEGEVEVIVRKRRKQRSIRQNDYYWGVVIQMIADETGNAPERVHEAMKNKFLGGSIVMRGEEFSAPESTTQLDTGQFSKNYVDQIKYWAQDFLGIDIPEAHDVYF